MTIRSNHRKAFRKNAGGSRGRSRGTESRGRSRGQSRGAESGEIVAPVRVREYPAYVPEPVTSQEIILIFLNEFFFNIVLILEPARINEIRRIYFLPWYNSCTPEQQRYWRILWGNPEVRLLIGDTNYDDKQAGEFNTRNDAGRGILNHRITMSLVFLVMLYHFAIAGATATNEYKRAMGLMNGGSKSGKSNYFGDGIENWINQNGDITIKVLLTGLEKNITDQKILDDIKTIRAFDGANEVLNKTIKNVADENKAVLREYLAKHKSPSAHRASPKTAKIDLQRPGRKIQTRKNHMAPRASSRAQ